MHKIICTHALLDSANLQHREGDVKMDGKFTSPLDCLHSKIMDFMESHASKGEGSIGVSLFKTVRLKITLIQISKICGNKTNHMMVRNFFIIVRRMIVM